MPSAFLGRASTRPNRNALEPAVAPANCHPPSQPVRRLSNYLQAPCESSKSDRPQGVGDFSATPFAPLRNPSHTYAVFGRKARRSIAPDSCQVWVPVEIQVRDHEVHYKLFAHRRQLLLCRFRSIAQEGAYQLLNLRPFSSRTATRPFCPSAQIRSEKDGWPSVPAMLNSLGLLAVLF